MNRLSNLVFLTLLLLVPALSRGQQTSPIQTTTPAAGIPPSPTVTPIISESSLEEEKKKLEIERMQLENEKLQLEMEKLKAQATQTVQKKEPKITKEEVEAKTQDLQLQLAKKSEALAKDNKDKTNLLILDFTNEEVWYKGIRYTMTEWNVLADNQDWKIRGIVDKRDGAGYERVRYKFRNVSSLKYETRIRGIFEVDAAKTDDDFKFLTPEGLSFDSSEGDVRNAYQGFYFKVDGVHTEKGVKIVRFKHGHDLDFDDKLEIGFDKTGKLVQIRYGVLDEN